MIDPSLELGLGHIGSASYHKRLIQLIEEDNI